MLTSQIRGLLTEDANSPKYRSITTGQFRKLLLELPDRVQKQARQVYALWAESPEKTDFRKLSHDPTTWRISIGLNYRAMAKQTAKDTFTWFWVGSHEAYNKKY